MQSLMYKVQGLTFIFILFTYNVCHKIIHNLYFLQQYCKQIDSYQNAW